jgi:putative ABC transport system permease protein
LMSAVLGGIGGYLLTNGLLSDLYAQHIDVNIVTVIGGGGFVFLIGLFATSVTIWRAANVNPVKAIASE